MATYSNFLKTSCPYSRPSYTWRAAWMLRMVEKHWGHWGELYICTFHTPAVLCTVLGAPVQETYGVQWRATEKIAWSNSHEERLRELAMFNLEKKRLGDLINVHKYVKGGCKKGRARLFSVVPSDKTRENRHKLKHVRFHLHQKKHFYHESDQALAQIAQRGCRVPVLGHI